jgi:hypothetical protein
MLSKEAIRVKAKATGYVKANAPLLQLCKGCGLSLHLKSQGAWWTAGSFSNAAKQKVPATLPMAGQQQKRGPITCLSPAGAVGSCWPRRGFQCVAKKSRDTNAHEEIGLSIPVAHAQVQNPSQADSFSKHMPAKMHGIKKADENTQLDDCNALSAAGGPVLAYPQQATLSKDNSSTPEHFKARQSLVAAQGSRHSPTLGELPKREHATSIEDSKQSAGDPLGGYRSGCTPCPPSVADGTHSLREPAGSFVSQATSTSTGGQGPDDRCAFAVGQRPAPLPGSQDVGNLKTLSSSRWSSFGLDKPGPSPEDSNLQRTGEARACNVPPVAGHSWYPSEEKSRHGGAPCGASRWAKSSMVNIDYDAIDIVTSFD